MSNSAHGITRMSNVGKSPDFPITTDSVGIIAGNGSFPIRFATEAKKQGLKVVAVCHVDETPREMEQIADVCEWIKVGELGKLIRCFKKHHVKEVAMAGGINRIKLFGGVKLDARAAKMIFRIRSTKDDLVMRAISEELSKDGISTISCTVFLKESLMPQEVLTKRTPTELEFKDIEVGMSAIKAMSNQHIGQLVVVREGVIVAVEAVEGTDATILRGGELGGPGTVVVKFAKPDQDMRFDVPTIGQRTIEVMIKAKSSVLAVEAGRSLLLDEEATIALANKHDISIVGCKPLVQTE